MNTDVAQQTSFALNIISSPYTPGTYFVCGVYNYFGDRKERKLLHNYELQKIPPLVKTSSKPPTSVISRQPTPTPVAEIQPETVPEVTTADAAEITEMSEPEMAETETTEIIDQLESSENYIE